MTKLFFKDLKYLNEKVKEMGFQNEQIYELNSQNLNNHYNNSLDLFYAVAHCKTDTKSAKYFKVNSFKELECFDNELTAKSHLINII